MKRLVLGLALAEDAVVVLFAVALVLLAGIQVVGRIVPLADIPLLGQFLPEAGTAWIEATASLLVMWLTIGGAVIAARQHQHLGIDVLSQRFGPRTQRVLGLLIALFAAAVCGVLADASWELLQLEREVPTEANAVIPGWIKLSALPVGFALMGLHYLIQMFVPVIAPVHGVPSVESEP